jgi:hypothetical protein
MPRCLTLAVTVGELPLSACRTEDKHLPPRPPHWLPSKGRGVTQSSKVGSNRMYSPFIDEKGSHVFVKEISNWWVLFQGTC